MNPKGLREWLPAISYDRPVTVLMAFVALLVIGIISWQRIPLQMMPSGFEPKFLWVWVPYPNSSPIESDEQVVRPIEAQLGTVPGIKRMNSRASAGSASFSLQFDNTQPMDDAYNAVVDRLERAMVDLPDDVERYWLYKYNPDEEPIMWVGVTFPDEIEDPYHVMKKVVQPRLERISGVASMDVWGVPQRQVAIDYDADRMWAHAINTGELHQRLTSDNFQMASGRVLERGRHQHVRSLARITEIDELARYPVRDSLVLDDVADIRVGGALSTDITRVNGREAAAMAIRKESSANTVEVSKQLLEVMDELQRDKRVEGAEFFVFFNQGELIEGGIQTLVNTALTGGVFAVIILFAFLREWRMTLLIAASIPFSLLITIGVLYFRGDSINVIALMGLMLAVGMVVDNAIVVVETIYRRRAEGAGVRAAAIGGTAEVNLAIIMSTLTTMVVFLPVILMGSDATFSFFLGVLGYPVIFALGASLIVALVFAPLATRYIGAADVKPDPRWLVWSAERYKRGLAWVLKRRADATMLLILLMGLTSSVAMEGVEFTDDTDGNINDFVIRYTVPPQFDMDDRDRITKAFEDVVEEHKEEWGVRVYRCRLRGSDTRGRIYVYLETDGPMPRDEVMKAAKKALPELPGVKSFVGWGDRDAGGGGNSITLTVTGEDMNTLVGLAEEIRRRTDGLEGVLASHVDVQNDGADEIQLIPDREALVRYGVGAQRIGNTVSWAMRGSTLPSILQGEREIPVGARFSLEDRSDLDTLLDFKVWSMATMGPVPLRVLTDVTYGKGPLTIRRTNRKTSTTVTLDLAEGTGMFAVMPQVESALQDMVLPRGYSWSRGFRFSQRQEDQSAQGLAMLLSVTFVFLLMGVLFESLVLPLSIITAIPMAMGGAAWALYLTGTPMDTMAGIGLVILVGVVVNNGIVLIDLVTQLRQQGMDRDEALIEAGGRRLRPILMTALTTISGLIPMALGGSQIIGIPYAPLGRTVIGGLAAATVLTLLFVPFLYAVLDDVSATLKQLAGYVGKVGAAGLLVVVMLPGSAEAGRMVSYGDALQGATDANPALRRAALSKEQAEAGVRSAQGIFDPTFGLTTNWNRSSRRGFFQGFPFTSETTNYDFGSSLTGTTATGTNFSVNASLDRNLSEFITDFGVGSQEQIQDAYTSDLNVSVTQQLLKGHRFAYNVQNVTSARNGLTVADLTLERTRQETLANAASSYWTWSYQVSLADIARKSVAIAEEALRVGKAQEDGGTLAPVEVTRLEAALVQARSASIDADDAARQAADALLLLMGAAPGEDIEPSTPPGDVPVLSIDLPATVDVALKQNLEIAVARANRDASAVDLANAKHARLPSLSATASAGIGAQDESSGAAIGGIFDEDAFPFIGVGGAFSMPIGNRAARGEVQRSTAVLLDQELTVEELQRSVTSQVTLQVRTLQAAKTKVELADANLGLAESTLVGEEARAKVGDRLQKDLLEARNEVDRARAEAAKARTDWRIAQVELLRLQGQLTEETP